MILIATTCVLINPKVCLRLENVAYHHRFHPPSDFGLQLDKTMDKARCETDKLADLMGVEGYDTIDFAPFSDTVKQQTDSFSCGYWELLFARVDLA